MGKFDILLEIHKSKVIKSGILANKIVELTELLSLLIVVKEILMILC